METFISKNLLCIAPDYGPGLKQSGIKTLY
ncbi:MAG: hypothetical protein JWM28_322 [Chitinophagaceae bacterium]|nr:hypothetical protein [Chitinophagaceae bacterium]